MKHAYLFPLSLLSALAILGGVYFTQYYTPPSPIPSNSTDTPVNVSELPQGATTEAPLPATPEVTGHTLAEVAIHNSAQSCWTAIDGNVYDVTSWISRHPGGAQAILSLCGKDGSVAFNGQHGGQRRPASELAGFKIGVLKK